MPRISVNNLHKDFRIYERPQDRLVELILRRPKHKVYHVLSDISFAVAEGKSLGIIGDNGAGKSTLLKLLVGTLQPTGKFQLGVRLLLYWSSALGSILSLLAEEISI